MLDFSSNHGDFLNVEQRMSTLELRMDVPPIWQWYCLCVRERETVREREGGMQRGNVLSIYITLKTLASNGRSRDLHI